MVNINLLELNEDATSLTVSVSTAVGNLITQALLWKEGATTKTDVSSLLEGVDETEDIVITAEDAGLTKFSGLYFLEFTSDEIEDNVKQGIVANYLVYHECLIDKAVAIKVKGCRIEKSQCNEVDNYLFANTLLDTLYSATTFGLFDEAIQIIETLNDICGNCSTCPDYGSEPSLLAGTGFKTVDDLITLI